MSRNKNREIGRQRRRVGKKVEGQEMYLDRHPEIIKGPRTSVKRLLFACDGLMEGASGG